MIEAQFVTAVFGIACLASLSVLFTVAAAWVSIMMVKEIIKELRNDK